MPKIVVTYLPDGQITSVDRQFPSDVVVSEPNQLEVTEAQINDFHANPESH